MKAGEMWIRNQAGIGPWEKQTINGIAPNVKVVLTTGSGTPAEIIIQICNDHLSVRETTGQRIIIEPVAQNWFKVEVKP